MNRYTITYRHTFDGDTTRTTTLTLPTTDTHREARLEIASRNGWRADGTDVHITTLNLTGAK